MTYVNKDVFSPIFTPISFDNQFTPVSQFFTNSEDVICDKSLQSYALWLDSEPNPPKSYRQHPIESEEQLNAFKQAFEKTVGMSLGAYLRIKRAYFILNSTNQTNQSNPKFTPQFTPKHTNICQFSYLNTPIGMMLAIFYQDKLCVLEFIERKMLETELNQVIKEKQCHFVYINVADNPVGQTLQTQLDDYFAGNRQRFDVALDTVGTDFQREVWQTLQTIDYGTTVSYQDEAEQMGKPTAMRAVANANGKNKISIVIPCHRVIRKSGDLGGYGGGLWRKRFLLELEQGVKS